MHSLKSDKSILLIFAHPDDHLLVAGTILKCRQKGYKIYEVIFTSGQNGMINGEKKDIENTKKHRLKEYHLAAQKLGIEEFFNFNQTDGFLKYDEKYVLEVVHLIRKLKPEMVISFEERDLHPDHINVSKMALRAVQLANISVELAAGETRFRVPKFLQIFGYVPGEIDYMIDTSEFFHQKHEILKIYASQHNQKMIDTIEVTDKRNALISPATALEGFKIHPSWPIIEE